MGALQLNNLDRLVNWSNEFLGRRDTNRVYPVPITMGNLEADWDAEDKNSNGGQPKH